MEVIVARSSQQLHFHVLLYFLEHGHPLDLVRTI